MYDELVELLERMTELTVEERAELAFKLIRDANEDVRWSHVIATLCNLIWQTGDLK